MRLTDRSETIAVFALLWLSGVYLRLTILVAPALAPQIGAELELSQTGIGALTTIPVLMLALGALPGSGAIARFGPRLTLAGALVVVALASLARGFSPAATPILLASAAMGLGIAAMQPALPALLPSWTPGRVAMGTAVYMNGMLVGEFAGAGLTLPLLMPLSDGNWRVALAIWSLPALAVAACYLWKPAHAREEVRSANAWLPDWRDPLLWQLGCLVAAGGSMFFGVNAYMSSVLEARGEGGNLTVALGVFNVSQVLASVTMLFMARYWIGGIIAIRVFLALSITALAVFWGFSGWLGMAGAFFLGYGTGVLLILVVALPPQLLQSSGAGRLAAGMFLIGYTLSFVLPLTGGALADYTGNASLALLPMLLFGIFTLGLMKVARLKPRDNAS